jgi:competence protein ComEA
MLERYLNILYKELKMTHQVKVLAIILFFSLLTLTTQVSVAQSDAVENKAKQTALSTVNKEIININKSTLEQLVTLKGVGKKKAHAIIAYRQRAGKFKEVSDLLNVKGIGIKVIEDNEVRLKI